MHFTFAVAALVSFAAVVHACGCSNGGTRDLTVSRCQCNCPTGWYPPTCNLRAVDFADVIITIRNTSTTRFSSTNIANKLATQAGQSNQAASNRSTQPVQFVRRLINREPVDKSQLVCVFKFRGDIADRLMRDIESSPVATWASNMNILNGVYYIRADAPLSTLAQSILLFSFAASGYTVPVTLQSLTFFLAAIGALLVFPIVEAMLRCCCSSSSEDEAAPASSNEPIAEAAPASGAVVGTAVAAAPPAKEDRAAAAEDDAPQKQAAGEEEEPNKQAGDGEAAAAAAEDDMAGWTYDEESGMYWSDEKKMFWDKPSGQYWDPDTSRWYNPETGEWTAEQ